MSRHSQPRSGSPLGGVAVSVLGSLVAVIVLGYLAGAAREFGALALDGQTEAWLFTGASVVGALACVLVIVVLVVRCLRALGFIREYRPRRASSRHPGRP